MFSLIVEGTVMEGSAIEYITVTLAFAVIIFGMTTLLSCSLAFFASIRRRVNLLEDIRIVFSFAVLLELMVFIFGVGTLQQIEELTHSIVEWSRFIKYYQEEYIRTDLDSIQRQLKCCGFQSYQDWDLNPYYSCNSSGYSRCSVPFSCCKLKNPDSSCVLGIRNPGITEAKLKELIYVDGCLKTSEIWYQYTIILLSFSSIMIAVLQCFLLYYLIILMKTIRTENKRTRKAAHISLDSKEDKQESEDVIVSKQNTIVKHVHTGSCRKQYFTVKNICSLCSLASEVMLRGGSPGRGLPV
jgi:hypothetical protein